MFCDKLVGIALFGTVNANNETVYKQQCFLLGNVVSNKITYAYINSRYTQWSPTTIEGRNVPNQV